MRRISPGLFATSLCAAMLAAAPAVLAQDANIAKPSCAKPQFPGRLASENLKKNFNKDVETYAQCIKKYVADQQKLADDHIKAANAAAAEYNTAVKELQSEIDKAKE